jgi:hypothetical protein
MGWARRAAVLVAGPAGRPASLCSAAVASALASTARLPPPAPRATGSSSPTRWTTRSNAASLPAPTRSGRLSGSRRKPRERLTGGAWSTRARPGTAGGRGRPAAERTAAGGVLRAPLQKRALDGRREEPRGPPAEAPGRVRHQDGPGLPGAARLLRVQLREFAAADGRLFTGVRGGDELPGLTHRRAWAKARQAALTPRQQASPLARRPYGLRHACPVYLAQRRCVPHTGRGVGRPQRRRSAADLRQVHRGTVRAGQAPDQRSVPRDGWPLWRRLAALATGDAS